MWDRVVENGDRMKPKRDNDHKGRRGVLDKIKRYDRKRGKRNA